MSRRVSAILAAHNEAPTIGALVAGIRAHTPDLAEILVVDDGSTDGTGDRAQAAGAIVHRLAWNQGKGVAIREGVARTTGDVILLMDADGQDDPREIPLLLEALAPEVDLVIGSRFLGRFGPNAITPINYAGNRFLTATLNVLFRTSVTDTQAGFKVLRRRALDGRALEAARFDIEVEVLLNVVRHGGVVREVPVSRAARAHGHSRLRSVRDGTIILRRILHQRFRT